MEVAVGVTALVTVGVIVYEVSVSHTRQGSVGCRMWRIISHACPADKQAQAHIPASRWAHCHGWGRAR